MYERGLGTSPNHAAAAYWFLKVVEEEGLELFRENAQNRLADTIAEIQRTLRDSGLYTGAIDGIAGSGTIAALRAYAGE